MIEINQKIEMSEVNTNEAEYLISYVNEVVKPSSEEFYERLKSNNLKLHQTFSFNAVLAHAIDYLVFLVRNIPGQTRSKFIKEFDRKYSVEGALHINNKFCLVDAVNNSFKHVELNKNRYKDLIERYGDLTFKCLSSENGKVFFVTSKYKFDYGRVVLRPIREVFNVDIKEHHDVISFLNGIHHGFTGQGVFVHDYEPWDAIDRMIEYCSAPCIDCGEINECHCSTYKYDTDEGKYNPDVDPNFDFDDAMSHISGTREWSK